MAKEERITSVVLLAMAVFYLIVGWSLPIWTHQKAMGPGMMPRVLGISLAVLAIILWIGAKPIQFGEEENKAWHEAWWTRIVTLMMLVAYVIAAIPLVGFTVANFLLVLGMRRVYEPSSWKVDVAGAVGIAIVLHVVFVLVLALQFPVLPVWW